MISSTMSPGKHAYWCAVSISRFGRGRRVMSDAGPTANFLEFTRPARLLQAALMLVGRLEIVAELCCSPQ